MVNFVALIGGTVLGCALKLTTSVDDLIWFSPFLALCKDNAERVKCCIIYSFVCLIVTFGAVAIAYLADVGFTAILNSSGSDNDYWDSARILSIIAAVAIGAYAAKEYREWIEEEDNKLPSFAEATTALKSCVAKVFNPAASYRPVGEDEDSVGSSSPRREPKSGSGDSVDAIGLEMEAIGDEDEHTRAVVTLLNRGAAQSINSQNNVGITTLMRAARIGNPDVIDNLLLLASHYRKHLYGCLKRYFSRYLLKGISLLWISRSSCTTRHLY